MGTMRNPTGAKAAAAAAAVLVVVEAVPQAPTPAPMMIAPRNDEWEHQL